MDLKRLRRKTIFYVKIDNKYKEYSYIYDIYGLDDLEMTIFKNSNITKQVNYKSVKDAHYYHIMVENVLKISKQFNVGKI